MARENSHKGLYASFSQKDMRGAAFMSLSPISQNALFWLELNYYESKNANPIEMPINWMDELLNCSRKTAAKVINELEDWGFIVQERKGKLKGPVRGRAAVYRLTWKRGNEGQNPTKEFRYLNS